MDEILIRQPDDWHLHLRDGAILPLTLAHARSQFGRVLAMPNLTLPVTRMQRAKDYQSRINKYAGPEVYYSLYLTDSTSMAEVAAASADPGVIAVKWYPAGATTNSDYGVTDIESCMPVLELMQEKSLVLSIHGEVTDQSVDIFDREAVFIERSLEPLRQRFPRLRIVLEHISSATAANYVIDAESDCLAATITPHHLLIDRNDLLVGGIKPHLYCLPIAKKSTDREVLLEAATSGNPCFFLGSDSAPHTKDKKEASCGCAGCYHGDHTLALYAYAFDKINKLEKLEDFASVYGCRYYGMEPSDQYVRLVRGDYRVTECYDYAGGNKIVPAFAGRRIGWNCVQP